MPWIFFWAATERSVFSISRNRYGIFVGKNYLSGYRSCLRIAGVREVRELEKIIAHSSSAILFSFFGKTNLTIE